MPTYSWGESCSSKTLNKVPRVSEPLIGQIGLEIMLCFTSEPTGKSAQFAWFVNLLWFPHLWDRKVKTVSWRIQCFISIRRKSARIHDLNYTTNQFILTFTDQYRNNSRINIISVCTWHSLNELKWLKY